MELARVAFVNVLLISTVNICLAEDHGNLDGQQSVAADVDLEQITDTLTKQINALREDTGIPSISIALLKDDRILWTKAFGYSNVKLKVPASPNTIYGTGSCFKPVTAMAVMQLVDRGKLKLDDPINGHLGDLAIKHTSPNTKPVTVRHLLAHYSGLKARYETASEICRYEPLWDRRLPTSLEELASELTIEEVPGTKFRYSNYGYCVAGLLVEKITGQSYEEFVVGNILRPVGVTLAGPVRPTAEMIEELALPYRLENNQPVPERQYRLDVYPAGDAYMNVPAMSKVLLTHLNGGQHNGVSILSEQSVAEMRRPQCGGKTGLDFGIRQFDGETLITHGGGVKGFSTKFILGVESKTGVYIASNASDALLPIRLLAQMSLDLLRGREIGTGLVREVAGIGISITADDQTGTLRVNAVLPQSPARQAGLAPGLVIQEINDVSVAGKSVKECLGMMEGPAGTRVCLKVADPDNRPTRTVELTKQTFLIPS